MRQHHYGHTCIKYDSTSKHIRSGLEEFHYDTS